MYVHDTCVRVFVIISVHYHESEFISPNYRTTTHGPRTNICPPSYSNEWMKEGIALPVFRCECEDPFAIGFGQWRIVCAGGSAGQSCRVVDKQKSRFVFSLLGKRVWKVVQIISLSRSLCCAGELIRLGKSRKHRGNKSRIWVLICAKVRLIDCGVPTARARVIVLVFWKSGQSFNSNLISSVASRGHTLKGSSAQRKW